MHLPGDVGHYVVVNEIKDGKVRYTDSDGNESYESNEVSNIAPNAPLNLKKN